VRPAPETGPLAKPIDSQSVVALGRRTLVHNLIRQSIRRNEIGSSGDEIRKNHII